MTCGLGLKVDVLNVSAIRQRVSTLRNTDSLTIFIDVK